MRRASEVAAAAEQSPRLTRLFVTIIELVGLIAFASLLLSLLVGIPMLATWLQLGRFGP